MPKKTLPLTDAAVRNAKPQAKAIKLFDGGGLYLEILPTGSRSWRMKYRFGGQEKRLTFGQWPEVSLKSARERREDVRVLMAKGVDPMVEKKARQAQGFAAAETLEAIAREWFAKCSPGWKSRTASEICKRFEKNVFPWIGARPIREIAAPELLGIIRRIESRGALEQARRTLQTCGQVWRYAIATGRADRDIALDLRGALPPMRTRHRAAFTNPKDIARLLSAISVYHGEFVTVCALRLAPLVFTRPVELRCAEWIEIDLDKAEWRIPDHKMKMKVEHIVPLSIQAINILKDLFQLTGTGRYVFPSVRNITRPMSENTINAALRYMGFSKEQMTGHGFRSMASTVLHEQGWPSDVIERQLGHSERNKVKASYNHAQHLPERRKMMQVWADYLDALKAGAKVTPLHAAGE